MARYLTTGTKSTIGAINTELEKIAVSQEDFLSRIGEEPNQMEADLDMNSNDILNLPFPRFPTSPVRLQDVGSITGASQYPTPQDFGAIGDGVTDDTLALQEWASVGGHLYLPRGLYKIIAPIRFYSATTVFGESAGSGTFNLPDYPTSLATEAQLGASIILCGADFVGDAAFFAKDDTAAIFSLNFTDIKFQMEGSDCHAIRIYKGYDGIYIGHINFCELGDNASAIKLNGNPDDGLNDISQTILIEHCMGIHSRNSTGAVVPTFDFDQCQEMTIVGVKAFAGYQASRPSCYGIQLNDCRGVNLVGCSVAHSLLQGINITATTRVSTGITLTGTTYENCALGSLRVLGTASFTCGNVFDINPRYQSPQSITFDAEYASGCSFNAGAFTGTLGANSSQNLVICQRQVNVTDNGANNEVVSFKNALDAEKIFNVALRSTQYMMAPVLYARANSTPNTQYQAGDTQEHTYRTALNASTGGGNLGFSLQHTQTGSTMEHQTAGHLRLTGATGAGDAHTRLVLDDSAGDPWRIRVDDSGNVYSVENADLTNFKRNADIPDSQTGVFKEVGLANQGQTIWMDNAAANTVAIAIDSTTNIPVDTKVMVMQEGAGTTTLSVASGVTLNGVNNGSCTISAQYTGATFVKRATNTWVVSGNISAVS